MEPDQNELATRFLLGKLPDEEQAAIEEEYFQNNKLFEDILIAENDLTDAYVLGRLSPDDSALFEARLLISPHQRQRAAFAHTFIEYAARQPVDEPVPPRPFLSRLFNTALPPFFVRPIVSYSIASAIVLLVAGGAFWWVSTNSHHFGDLATTNESVVNEIKDPLPNARTGEHPTADELGNVERSKEDTSARKYHQGTAPKKSTVERPARPQPVIATIILSLGSTRSADASKVFVIPEKADVVKLKLPFEDGGARSYYAVVETAEGQQISSGKVFASSSQDNSTTATLVLAARRLKRGDYVIMLKALNKNGTYEPVADYTLTLDRR